MTGEENFLQRLRENCKYVIGRETSNDMLERAWCLLFKKWLPDIDFEDLGIAYDLAQEVIKSKPFQMSKNSYPYFISLLFFNNLGKQFSRVSLHREFL